MGEGKLQIGWGERRLQIGLGEGVWMGREDCR